jgi:hypothetical protein
MAFNTSKIKSIVSLVLPKTLPVEHKTFRSDTEAIFIGGCGRSGTTLLRIMLGRHSQVYSAPELNVHANALQVAYKQFPYLPKKVYLLYDKEVLAELSRKFHVTSEFIKKIRDESTCLADFVDRLMGTLSKKEGKLRWVEKTPKNATILPFLFKYFPKGKFIHIIRDGRDVACSLRNHPKYFYKNGERIPSAINKPISQCVMRWVYDVRAALLFRGDSRYLEIKYEELVAQPEKIMKQVFSFLELPFEETVLKTNTEEKKDAEYFLPSARAVESIDEASIGRYTKDLTKAEAKVVEKRAGELLRKFGYTKGKEWLSLYE